MSFIIARAPYRVSFFGGGTDYPVWYRENPGAVLATSIDKYCYIIARRLPPFFEEKNRVVWSKIELTETVEEITHPAVREALKFLGLGGIEIHHAGDLPARTGIGTSSSFMVALLDALYTLKGINASKMMLAVEAIHIEQDLIKEAVGSQDQVSAAFGGLNRIDFALANGRHQITVTPIKTRRKKELEKCLMLFFTGFSRTASKLAGEIIARVKQNRNYLEEMYEMVAEGVEILQGNGDLSQFGQLLGESWSLKKQLSSKVSTDYIDYLYANAISAGARGGKLTGAGGGGFLLLFVEPEAQAKVKERLSSLLHVPFNFESWGSQIIFK